MVGYNPNFLGQEVPLPSFSASLIGSVLNRTGLEREIYAQYHNYTVVMNRELRTPIFAAVNIDQTKIKSVRRSSDWRIDSRIGADYQLNNDYYYRNPWDRGHLVRRAAAAWGETVTEAKHASDDTFFFSNCSLQHENLNQDEWLALEDWVMNLTADATNKINVVTGPFFGETPRSITPQGRTTALIPSGFFKVITFINSNRELETRAFVMLQDNQALADKEGRRTFTNQRYQVSVTEIEELTGLIFPSRVPETNPLFFNDNSEARERLSVSSFPERIEVDSPQEMVGTQTPREMVKDREIDVFIAAALVNASEADERFGEWVSILNCTNERVELEGWKLKDPEAELNIAGSLAPGEAMQIAPLSPIQLGNRGGSLSLYNEKGERVDGVKYIKQGKEREGKPVIFSRPREI